MAVGPVALGEALCVLAAHQEQAGLLAAALVAHLVVAAFVMQGTFCQGLDYVWEERERGGHVVISCSMFWGLLHKIVRFETYLLVGTFHWE